MKKIITLFIFMISLGINSSYASHALGAEITYTCTGTPNEYNLTVAFYRDCDGISSPNPIGVVFTNTSGGCSNFSQTIPISSFSDITPLCPGEASTCNGGSIPGVEKYVYEAIVTIPAGCVYKASFSEFARNTVITNLANTDIDIYVETIIDNTLGTCNSSPQFTNPASFYACVGQEVNYNHGAIDLDGDELKYSLAPCMSGFGQIVPYVFGLSGSNPVITDPSGPITIDPVSGAISFLPSAAQVAVICVKVEEFRNGIKIGEVVRDIQFNIFGNCSLAGGTSNDNAPTISSATNYSATCNTELCFNIITEELDGDNITISSPNQLGGSFTPALPVSGGNPSTQYCWTPTNSDVGLKFLTVTVIDDGCPPLSNTYTYQIDVSCGIPPPYDCPAIMANYGDSCDDNDPNTSNDVINSDCDCVGTTIGTGDLTLTCPVDIIKDASAGTSEAMITWASPTATTNCAQGGTCNSVVSGFVSLGEYDGSEYFISEFPNNWLEAQSKCQNNGGYLVAINSQAENDFLTQQGVYEQVLIGLTDTQTEGSFEWIDGSPLTYENWKTGQPDNMNTGGSLDEDYSLFNLWEGKWEDVSFWTNKKYIMERPCSGTNLSPISISQVQGPSSGNTFSIGTTQVCYEATDGCGGLAQCCFDVTVNPPNNNAACTNFSNLALNQPTSQSSTLSFGGIDGNSDKAVDGNTNGVFVTADPGASTVSATQINFEPYWQVDLGDFANIETIKVFNRTDGVDKTFDFYVLVSDVPFNMTDLANARAQATFESYQDGAAGTPSLIDINSMGRYVRIQMKTNGYLTLAEVEVIGCIPSGGGPSANCSVTQNVALNKSATQSGTQQGREAGLAVDGTTNGNATVFNSVSMSDWQTNPWWEVDLGGQFQLEDIEIWNRTECCNSLLENYYVFVSQKPFNSTDLDATIIEPGVTNYFQTDLAGFPSAFPIGQMGRYVRIQLKGDGFLTMAEVKINGCAMTSSLMVAPQQQLLTLQVSKENRATDLNWLNNTGTKNKIFEIERSKDGIIFTKFDQLTNLNNQSNAIKAFNAKDLDPRDGYNYYRIKLTFNNGSFTYSNVERIQFSIEKNVRVFPNPATDKIYFVLERFEGKSGTIQLVNSFGHLIHQQRVEDITNIPYEFSLDGVINGTYTLFFKTDEGARTSSKIVIMKTY